MVKCECGLNVATRTSWTHENPGRKFVACKFYNHETGQRGCNTFEWVDEGILDWQRDVTNILVAEKHRVTTDNHILKSRLVCVEHEKNRLAQELEEWKKKPMKKKESQVENDGLVNLVLLCAIVSVVVSFMVVKLLG